MDETEKNVNFEGSVVEAGPDETKDNTPENSGAVGTDDTATMDKTVDKNETLETASGINSKKSGTGTIAIAISVAALILGGCGLGFGVTAYQKANAPLTFLNSGVDGNSANFVEGSIAEIADKVSASVVSIVTSTKTTNFFGQDYESAAAGTGIIVTSDGYVLTNKHVINGATSITVVLDDGTTYENVELATVDPLNDVAFLKIKDVSDLSPATLGDSKTINVGQQVMAIGNALGQYQNTVTVGVVSGLGRSVTASDESGYNVETLTDMIQTDAAINSGNSGGPLVNAAGEVIGINTATSTTAENMGFAIPISSVKGMLKQLEENGSAERAYLGVYTVEITPEVAKAYNLPANSGAYLYSSSSYSAIVKDSPAAKAGLKDKDIVTAVNGVEVGKAGTLADLVGEYVPGDTVQLTVVREGKDMAVNVTLEGYKK